MCVRVCVFSPPPPHHTHTHFQACSRPDTDSLACHVYYQEHCIFSISGGRGGQTQTYKGRGGENEERRRRRREGDRKGRKRERVGKKDSPIIDFLEGGEERQSNHRLSFYQGGFVPMIPLRQKEIKFYIPNKSTFLD